MKIKDLPKKYQTLALANQVAQGNEENLEISLNSDARNGNFNWDQSHQGWRFWDMISSYTHDDIKLLLLSDKIELIRNYIQSIENEGKNISECKSDLLKIING